MYRLPISFNALQNGDIAVFSTENTLSLLLGTTFITYNDGGVVLLVKEYVWRYQETELGEIIRIIRPAYHANIYTAGMDFWLGDAQFLRRRHEVLWEKDPSPKFMTMKELEEFLTTHKIKIVKE